MADISRSMRIFWFAAALIFVFASATVHAQPLPGSGPADEKLLTQKPLDDLSEEQIYQLMSRLGESQVRELLLKRLVDDAKKRAEVRAEADERTLRETAALYSRQLGAFFWDVGAKVPAIPGAIERAAQNFQSQAGHNGLFNLAASLALCLASGLAVAFGVRWLTRRPVHWLANQEPHSFWQKIGWLILRLLLQLSVVAGFFAAAELLNLWINRDAPGDRETLDSIFVGIAWTWVTVLIARFVLSPANAKLRLTPVDDHAAWFLTQRTGVIAAIYNFGFGFVTWMVHFGAAFSDHWLGAWVHLIFHLAIGLTIWQARDAISRIVDESDGRTLEDVSWIARWWPHICVALVAIHWFLVELVVATSSIEPGLFTAMIATLAVVLALPLILQATRAVAVNLLPVSEDRTPALQAADQQTQAGLIRITRVVVTATIGLVLLRMWDIDITSLAERGVGARYASALIDTALIGAVAYGLWELVRVVTDRQIVMEQVARGIDPTAEAELGSEGGGAGARLGTLLPLVKFAAQIAIVVLASLAVLGQLGVNVLPLLAGAGIVGLAIGFGAQTLVKDVISGIFFLVDDAFRLGEYIETGSIKGTVERISIRSMQLRHHNGPLNTVPYGDIGHITNYSRDWVVMKLPLRLTYDTDAEMVRKMIKKLGEQLLADPKLGPQFLQPLKSQGVIQMEDSAMIMRVKFMTRPGDQWVIRRTVFAKIRDLFEANGIKFANREVTVRFAGDDDRLKSMDKEQRDAVAGSAARLVQTGDVPPAR